MYVQQCEYVQYQHLSVMPGIFVDDHRNKIRTRTVCERSSNSSQQQQQPPLYIRREEEHPSLPVKWHGSNPNHHPQHSHVVSIRSVGRGSGTATMPGAQGAWFGAENTENRLRSLHPSSLVRPRLKLLPTRIIPPYESFWRQTMVGLVSRSLSYFSGLCGGASGTGR